jgi:polyhydroxyalkanoate synthesis regulator phasin
MATRKVSEPVQDALKAYLELALGLTEASKKKAEKAVKKMAKELVGKGNATAAQIQGAVEELVATSIANREAVTRLVRVEMDRTLSRVGLATSDEVSTLQARVEALERELRDERAAAAKAATAPADVPATVKAVPPAKAQPHPQPPRKATVAKTASPTVAKAAKPTVSKATVAKASKATVAKAASPAVAKTAKTAKATVVKKAPVVKKEPTVRAASSSPDVPVAPKKAPAKKAVKKAVPVTEATP